MDNTELINALSQVTDGLNKMGDSFKYTTVGFTSQPAGLNPLVNAFKTMIVEIYSKLNKSYEEKLKGLTDEVADGNKGQKEENEALKTAIGVLRGIQEKAKNEENDRNKKASTLNQYFQKSFDSWKDGKKNTSALEKMVGISFQSFLIGKDILKTSKAILENMNSIMLTNAEFAASLRQAGVSIQEGFDEGFLKYAQIAGKDREKFVQMLTENAGFVTSANAKGLNGVNVLANQANKLTGILGLSGREIESSIKAYNESMLTTANAANIAGIDHTNELIRSTSALKSFAMATGQSYENIIKEQKAKEKSWQMQRLATDPRTRSQFMMMRNAGLSDDMIEAIMLNKHNKASTMAMLDPNSARMMNEMRRAYMSTINNPEAFADALVRLNHSSAAEGMRRREANTNVMDYAYINGLGELFAPGTTQWGMLTARNMDFDKNRLMKGTDVKAINAVQETEKELSRSINKLKDAMSPSLKTIADNYPTMTKALTWMTDFMGNVLQNHPWLGAILMGGQMLAPLASSILPMFIFGLMSKTKPAIINISKDAAKHFSITMTAEAAKAGGFFSKLTGVLSKGASLLGKGLTGATLGSVASDLTGGNSTGGLVGGVLGSLALPALAKFGASRLIGSTLGKALGAFGGPVGVILGSLIGGWAGGAIGNLFEDKPKNEPASAPEYSSYNESNQSSSNQTEVVQTQHNVVSLNGMDTLKSLLRDINSNTKAVVTELRNSGFKTGSNLAT